MTATKGITPYPHSTKQGAAIPHEVALPVGVLRQTVLADSSVTVSSIPEDIFFITAESTVDCILDFRLVPEPLANGQFAEGVIFLPADTVLVFAKDAMPDAAYGRIALTGLGEQGTLTIHAMSAWGSLGEAQELGALQ